MAFIIGLGHRSGHGKDTAANYIKEELIHRYSWLSVRKVSWAWKLKQICYELYSHLGLKEPDHYETEWGRAERNVKLPRINLTPVEIWIKMGTDAVRNNVWQPTWVEYVKYNIYADIIIAPDSRFPNEMSYCDFKVKVVNPREPNRKGLSVDDELAGYTDWDHIIMNNGTKEGLRQRCVSMLTLPILNDRLRQAGLI